MENQSASPMSVKDWLITFLVLSIPLVGVIMLFVWAFGSGGNPTKAVFCKAALIWAAILIVLSILFSLILGGTAFLLGS